MLSNVNAFSDHDVLFKHDVWMNRIMCKTQCVDRWAGELAGAGCNLCPMPLPIHCVLSKSKHVVQTYTFSKHDILSNTYIFRTQYIVQICTFSETMYCLNTMYCLMSTHSQNMMHCLNTMFGWTNGLVGWLGQDATYAPCLCPMPIPMSMYSPTHCILSKRVVQTYAFSETMYCPIYTLLKHNILSDTYIIKTQCIVQYIHYQNMVCFPMCTCSQNTVYCPMCTCFQNTLCCLMSLFINKQNNVQNTVRFPIFIFS